MNAFFSDRDKTAHLHKYVCYQAHINSKCKSHKITRKLSCRLKNTNGQQGVVFFWF